MKEYNLGGTFLLQYDALIDPRYQQLLKNLPRDSFEIGAWWEIPQPMAEKAGLKWRGRYPWDWHANIGFTTGYTPTEREKLADVYMTDFKNIFGYYPKSVASWFIDAHTLVICTGNIRLLLPQIARTNMARTAIPSGEDTGTRLTTRARSIPICLPRIPKTRSRYPFSGCWGAIPSASTTAGWVQIDRP